ncbi:hypothetical protein F11_14340 [Rhodospirillum rubrum F11]|uniref:Heavy-metal-associated domain-containing protein n=3 Tax=Rhodospirillum rubrum TaxID=1085 RepID=Q2RQK3_RHORT|nr:hypothetical protein [Rhodospirillum rubrum]ABC23592.1 hypothetical protein Rru_A2795 [Rhodospirillum rubrum ATCC 11170]AEO49330.1 hypothetical protein F11_14340 [Rhodospirillum rubrum F11]MBK5955267.1 hypothetical protein [Rhodospirillum rubrum]QXG79554.1 hypothetical protein KUL73_14410 [Rhodospirillum rubrum]
MAYIHSVPGRMRVKCNSFKRDEGRCLALRQELAAIDGVADVSVNARAHSLIVVYDPAVVGADRLLRLLRDRGVACQPTPTVGQSPARRGRPVSVAVVSGAAAAFGGAFGRAVFGAVLKSSLERGVASLVSAAIR